MPAADAAAPPPRSVIRESAVTVVRTFVLSSALLLVFATMPVLAQSSGAEFCDTNMAQTIKNIFTLIQFGGPLVGGVIALGAVVAIPSVRSSDVKRELKGARNQAIIWGVIVAPLGTEIVKFLLNNVVVGGASCGF